MPQLKIEEFLQKLSQVKREGTGWMACCPAHSDKTPSLSVKISDGKILLKCFANCSLEEICSALGIQIKDLFIEKTFIGKNQNGQSKKIKATYDYTDESGNLLSQAVRYEPKGFSQRRPDGNGGFIYNLQKTRLVLYRLPEVLASPLVYLVEGEKDVETLRKNDLPATCNPMGAGKWKEQYNESLRDKTVVILPDNDDAGRNHAEAVASSLNGIAKEIVVVNLPNLPDKGDVTDYFQNGGTVDELIDLVSLAESWKPTIKIESKPQSKTKFVFTPLSEMLSEPIEETSFVWENTLPSGGFSICSAKPKVGKSTLARNLAVAIVRGQPFLNRATVKGKVLYLCLEEKRSEVVKHFREIGTDNADILIHTGSTPENAIEELASAIAELEPVLVIIDPLSRVLRVRDFNDYGGMARGLEPLIDLARRTNVHILALHHDSKMERSGGDSLLGSTALFGAVDCHIQLRKREQSRTVSTTQRYGEDIPETVIELEKGTGIITAQGDLQTVVLKQAENEILKVINENEELSELQIKDRIEGFSSQGIISKAIRNLVEERKLRRKGMGRKGDAYFYSKLIEVEF